MSAPALIDQPRQLLDHLRGAGVQIWVEDGNNLRLVAPSGLIDEALKQNLKTHKAGIIALLGAPGAEKLGYRLVPDPQNRCAPFPLTDIQRAYWVGRQQAFDLGDVAIHFYTEVDCRDLDIPRLERAWNRVVRRHDMLRAVVKEDGEQRILAEVDDYRIEIHALQGLHERDMRQRLREIRQRLSHSRRATDSWPGFAIEVAQLDTQRSSLHISIDLLHVDGASLHILFDDWSAYYADEGADLPALQLSYRDYVLAELEQQSSSKYAQDLAYWKKEIAELPPAPALPLTKEADTTTFVRHGFKLDEITFQRLKKRATALGITPTVFVMLAFAEIIRHWSKEPSFTMNVTLFNRLPVHAEVNRLVGDFTSMILLGMDHQPGESLAAKAARMQRRLWSHLDHRTVSGVKVLGELNAYQKNGAPSIMPVVFTSLLDLKGQGFSPDWLEGFGDVGYTLTQTPQVYLDHQIRELKNGGAECTWDVIPGMFPPGMVYTMIEAYEKLLHELIGNEALWAESALSFTPAEQLAQREELNRTQQILGSENETLYSLFLKQAEQREESTALIHADTALRYGELRNAAQALGKELLALGAGPERVVAILMEKGWEQVVAALGIHAAGAAYLPIDVEQPESRIRYFLENSGAMAVLAQPQILHGLALPAGLPVISLDAAWLEATKARPTLLPVTIGPDHLSHVIYTSGSTGQPKGVMVEHRSTVNRLVDINRRYSIGPNDKALALSALHHDLSVYDLFGLFIAGGQIVIPEAAKRKDPAHWLELLVKHQISVWNSVPAFLEMLVDYQEEHAERAPALPASLRFVILAGDWIPVSLPSRVHRQRPDLLFVASGGPTETTIWDIYYHVGEVDPAWTSIPYGKPLANSRYYILNKLLKPCPTWVPGEMYIGGTGLTRGYLGDAEKTAAKFIIHPDTGERLYRSGDLGRYLPDGNIEFLGREDFQVKIRGQRIELAEIEAAVRQHEGVRNALVQVQDGEHGKSLALYVVPEPGAVADVDFRIDEAQTHSVDDEARDFERQGAQITDPAQRLLFKMEQRGLRRLDNAATIALEKPQAANDWRSHRDYVQQAIPLAKFGRFLALLGGRPVAGEYKYNYGSGGGLYPVQAYVHIKQGRVEGLDAGLYYYHPHQHALQFVAAADVSAELHYTHNRATVDGAAFSVFFIGNLDAIVPLYGELGREMCFLEAGAMAQILRAQAPAEDIGVCQIGHLRFDGIAAALGIDERHVLLASMVGGAIAADAGTAQAESLAAFKDSLAAHLEASLPQHMRPSRTFVLNAFPITANGKIHRAGLPSAPCLADQSPEQCVAAENELETLISELWKELLGLEHLSVERNFFDLGANSALIVKAYHRLRERIPQNFPLITMFRFPTVRALARSIGGEGPDTEAQAASDARAEKRKQRLQAVKERRESK